MSKPKRHRKYSGSYLTFETFLIKYGLQTVGGLLILGGLIYMLASNFNAQSLLEFWKSFSNSTEKSFNPSDTRSASSGYFSLLLYVPGIILLAITYLRQGINTVIKNVLVSLAFVWLILAEGKILLDIRTHHIELSYYLLLVSFCTIQIIVTGIAIAGKDHFALNWSVIYFFASVIMIRLIYGVIIPNIIILIFMQVAVSVTCYIYKWKSPFILLMTLSSVYISYYFIKLLISAGDSSEFAPYMLPGLLVWFTLAVTGFGILKTDPGRKISSYIWYRLPYATLIVVLGLILGYYYKSGINYLSFVYYSLTVVTLVSITILNRKYSFLAFGDPFYLSLCIFSAFLLPQLFPSGFLLILSANLAVTLLVNTLLTDLKINFRISMGMYFVSLGFYLADWALRIIPALVSQGAGGTAYSLQLVVPGMLLFALSYFYRRLFTHILDDYSFSQAQTRQYKSMVKLVYNIIIYLTLFLVIDFVLTLVIPGYRVNFIEWGLYTYSFLYFLSTGQNSKSRTKLRYILLLLIPAIILYPLVIHPETIYFRTLYLAGDTTALLPFIMHYLSIGVMILIILKINKRLSLLYSKSLFITNTRILSGIVILCFILLSESDHLLLLSMSRLSTQPAYEILQFNKFIPYSVILLLVSVALLVFSLVRYTRFLRLLSMIMILAVLLKVLFIDITILPANTSIFLLISLGAILVALSFLIPRFRKQSGVDKTS